MKQIWTGILVFVAIGAAAYLTSDLDRRFQVGSTTTDTKRHTKKGVLDTERKSAIAAEIRNPSQIWGGVNSVFNNPSQFLSGANSIVSKPGNLTGQLAGSVFEKEITENEIGCRKRLRQLGVVIVTGPCTDVSEIVDNLAKGSYSFNKPSTANVGDRFPLRLILKTADSQDTASSFVGLPGMVEQHAGSFAQSVEASLTGDDFEISPTGPQARTATRSHPVEWEWKLKPTSTGTKTVTIEVAANIAVGSENHRVQINTLHESIIIQVSMLQRITAYLAEVNGLVVASAALATSLGILIGFVPTTRNFFKSEVARWRRKPNRAGRRN
jgi:hypothetical protein